MRYIVATIVLLWCSPLFAIGLLVPKNDNARPFDIVSHRATVAVTNTAAVTTVEQVFKNHTNRPIEAQFVFPIPEGGTVSNFSLWINGKKTAGAVLEKDEARKIYESIVRRVEDPGLIEYMDGKLFKTSLFPIPANGTQKMEIQFGQVLEKTGDMYRYVYPLRAGERYVTAKTEKDFTLTGTITSAIPIRNIYSPSHKLGVSKKSETRAIVGTESVRENLDRDFELYISFSKKDIGISLMTHDPDGEKGEKGYFMVALSPKFEAKAHAEIGQTVTLVMDTSGSMAGPKIEQARSTLKYCISQLRPQDHFNIVRFSTDVETWSARPVKATMANKKAAVSFAKEISASGGTSISEALTTAVSQKTPAYQPHQIIFVTDGQPTVGTTDTAGILAELKAKIPTNARIFTFGVGYEINTILLDAIASETRGRPDYIQPNGNLQNAVATLYRRISAPVMTNMSIDFGKTRVVDMYPTRLPDLFRGDQIVLFGRNKNAFASPITVTGRIGKEKKVFRFGGSGSKKKRANLDKLSTEPLEFLPKLWATRKVGFLLDNIRINGERAELKNEVIRLGKKFGLVTPYTSYLAVDDSEFIADGRNSNFNSPPMDSLDMDEQEESEPIRSLSDRAKSESKSAKREKKKRRVAKTKPSPKPKKNRASVKLDSMLSGDIFGATGEGAVAAAEANRDFKEKERVDQNTRMKRRYVSSKTFEYRSGVWWEANTKGKKLHKITAYSKAFFKLTKTHPELKKIAAELGTSIVVKLGKRVYRISPKKK